MKPQFKNALEYMYDRPRWLKKRFPKAAKRKRIQTKWRNKYGGGLFAQFTFLEENKFLSLIKKEPENAFFYLPVPIKMRLP